MEDKEMITALEIFLAFIVCAAVGTPIVYIFDKWKKEMDESE
jgi:hypothetical protein